MDTAIDPRIEMVMLGIRDRKTHREIAEQIHLSHGMINHYQLTFLLPQELVSREVNPLTGRAKARSLKLTQKGKEYLEHAGHKSS